MASSTNNGWVYLLQTKDRSFYKIGSGADLKRRCKQIKLQLPFDVEVAAAFYCSNFRSVERQLHKELARLRLNGEWFFYDMPVIFPAFLEAADFHSSASETYFLDEDNGWLSLTAHNALYPISKMEGIGDAA